jgi:glycosyltransferase involved in cell wall biosynthesis
MNLINLSVIIPTCNRSTSIRRAIDSVLYQQIDKIEIIVIDDGTDKISEKLLRDYVARDEICYFKNLSGTHGPASARNYGVSKSRGVYITFLDDDDIYLPGRLSNMLKVIHEYKYLFVSSGRLYEVNDFSRIKLHNWQLKGVVRLKEVLYGNDIDIGFMIKREDFIRLDGFDVELKSLEDWDFILRALRIGDAYKINRLDYVVNMNPNRPRISSYEYAGYKKLADKHRQDFGDEWYAYTCCQAARLNGMLTIIFLIKMILLGRSFRPIKLFLKSKFQR